MCRLKVFEKNIVNCVFVILTGTQILSTNIWPTNGHNNWKHVLTMTVSVLRLVKRQHIFCIILISNNFSFISIISPMSFMVNITWQVCNRLLCILIYVIKVDAAYSMWSPRQRKLSALSVGESLASCIICIWRLSVMSNEWTLRCIDTYYDCLSCWLWREHKNSVLMERVFCDRTHYILLYFIYHVE